MKNTINIDLHFEGYLPGPLEVKRKAKTLLYNQSQKNSIELRLISAYAYSVSEVNASELSYILMGTKRVSFDTVVETMKETGHDLNPNYRETSLSGLAKTLKK